MGTPHRQFGAVSGVGAIIGESVPAGEGRIVLDVVRYTVVTTRRSMD
jgi:hypothetical protein